MRGVLIGLVGAVLLGACGGHGWAADHPVECMRELETLAAEQRALAQLEAEQKASERIAALRKQMALPAAEQQEAARRAVAEVAAERRAAEQRKSARFAALQRESACLAQAAAKARPPAANPGPTATASPDKPMSDSEFFMFMRVVNCSPLGYSLAAIAGHRDAGVPLATLLGNIGQYVPSLERMTPKQTQQYGEYVTKAARYLYAVPTMTAADARQYARLGCDSTVDHWKEDY